ncbi:MAG: insulinase family protein [Opitutaceae bacterium]|nr:insulinase family protein [Opitutaceae bacterium]
MTLRLSFLKRAPLVLLSALALLAPYSRSETTAFAFESSDIKPDPAIRFGKLPNGLRYAIAANAEPKGRASLRLLVEAGSLNETEPQRGVAHFLEHMAFNGSTHYPPGTLIEFFQRMGMNFGGDTNASTSFDRTLYLLELADTHDTTIAEGLRVFSDYASGLLLQTAEIDRERGIILSEKRARDSVGFRTFVAQFEQMLGSTLFPKRLPIGLVEVIEKAPRSEFVEFYNAWYRPELISVVAVGDFDVAAVEKQIISTFSPMSARAPAEPKPDLGRIVTTPGIHAHFHAEPEAPSTSISISSLFPYSHEPDTVFNRTKNLPRSLASAMINRRFNILSKKENAAFLSASTGVFEQFDFLREATLDLTAKADQWQAALAVGEQELRRALQYGFNQGELDEVRASFINNLEQAVKSASTRRSPSIAGEIANNILYKNVSSHPKTDLEITKPALEKITPEQCLQALRDAWKSDHRFVFVSGNATIPDSEAAITSTYRKSVATEVAAPAGESTVAWSYTDFGPAGKIESRTHIDDLDITQATFANGVRVNLKKTPYEAGRIHLFARVGIGALSEPVGERGLVALANATFDAGGLGRHSTDDLQRILSGRNVSVGLRMGQDHIGFGGSTTPRDLLLTLQLLTAKLTDPGYRPESLRLARKNFDQMYLGFKHTSNGPLSTDIASLLAGGDPRFGLPPRDVLMSRTLDEVKAWMTPQLTRGAIEFSIVGDIDIDATLTAISQTLGALPEREPRPDISSLTHVKFPATPFDRTFMIDSQIPKGLAMFYWPTTDSLDVHVGRRLGMLSNVLEDRLRLKLREDMGGTYSPSTRSFSSDILPGYGYIASSVDIDPAMADRIAGAIRAISASLQEDGATADELERSKLPTLTSIRESARTNNYWLNSVLSRAQERPEVLDWARSREADYASITVAEINALAQRYFSPERISHALILPAAKAPAPAAEKQN